MNNLIRLTEEHATEAGILYLNSDPEEIINVIDDSKYMDILFNMKEKMETCDVVPFETDWRFRRR